MVLVPGLSNLEYTIHQNESHEPSTINTISQPLSVNDIVNLIAGNIKRVPAHAFRQQRAYNVKDLTVDGTTANGLQYPYLNSKKYQKFLNERKIWESRSKRIIPQVVEATNDSQKGRGLILSAYKGIQKYTEYAGPA